MTTHDLKCWPEYFAAVLSGDKPFEIRKNDRGFAVGDVLILREWSPEQQVYTERICIRKVTYVTCFSQQHGFVVLGLAVPNAKPKEPKS